jgi:hypothetical protein
LQRWVLFWSGWLKQTNLLECNYTSHYPEIMILTSYG